MDFDLIKANIIRIRRELEMTQEEMADKLGISRTAYRNLEKGRVAYVNGSLLQIAELSGKTVEEILLGYDPSTLGDGQLRETENLREKLKATIDYYEERLRVYEENLRIKDDSIKTLSDINNRLNRQLDKND